MSQMNSSQFLTLALFAFFASSRCVYGNAECLPEQRSLLLDLKHGFTFPPQELESWKPSSNCCRWKEIICDPKSGSVIELDLSGHNITGGIDFDALFGLTSLRTLNLSNNWFFGISISQPEFEKLKELRQLDLSNTGFEGQIPIGISRLARLEYLDLSCCLDRSLLLRSPSFHTIIRDLNNLRVLRLGCVDLQQDVEWGTALFTSVPQLQLLDLSHTNLTGSLSKELFQLKALEYLDLSWNRISGVIPASIENLTQLVDLDLSYNNITGAIPASIRKLAKLTRLRLSGNGLTGPIPGSLFSLPLLQVLDLASNQLSGELDVPLNASTSLKLIYLSGNQLCGQIPPSFFYLPSLVVLDLHSNNFSGAIELDRIAILNNLTILDLSNNRLSLGEFDDNNFLSFPNLELLNLASCGLTKVPTFLNNQDTIRQMDLSNNMLQGPIPVPPPSAYFVDFSNNNFSSTIIPQFFFNLGQMGAFSVANNNLMGEIPPSICKATALYTLDLSNNHFSGSIPSCLLEICGLVAMNLAGNWLQGTIPQTITKCCQLRSIILSDNHLEGSLPRSLVHCSSLLVLDLGNNHIEDTFPFWLGDIVPLQVLSLRANRFHGPLGPSESPDANCTFPKLQVFDLSSNYFNGKLSPTCFSGLRLMRNELNSTLSPPDILQIGTSSFYEIDITVFKGQELQLDRMLKIFYIALDFSNNSFEGDIPQVIGGLQGLHVLNLSHNSLTSNIPLELGNLTQLEVLDLSTNHLSGEIPQHLTSLTSLEILNLSNNNLAGRIPQDNQFSTFSNASFQENPGLCGIPLSKQCGNAMPPAAISDHSSSSSRYVIGLALFVGIGFGVGIAVVLVLQNVPLKFLRRGR